LQYYNIINPVSYFRFPENVNTIKEI